MTVTDAAPRPEEANPMNTYAIFFNLHGVKAVEVIEAENLAEAVAKSEALADEFEAPVAYILIVSDQPVSESE
jgi:glyoxylate carboligase